MEGRRPDAGHQLLRGDVRRRLSNRPECRRRRHAPLGLPRRRRALRAARRRWPDHRLGCRALPGLVHGQPPWRPSAGAGPPLAVAPASMAHAIVVAFLRAVLAGATTAPMTGAHQPGGAASPRSTLIACLRLARRVHARAWALALRPPSGPSASPAPAGLADGGSFSLGVAPSGLSVRRGPWTPTAPAGRPLQRPRPCSAPLAAGCARRSLLPHILMSAPALDSASLSWS